jgi:hypothetical protein
VVPMELWSASLIRQLQWLGNCEQLSPLVPIVLLIIL